MLDLKDWTLWLRGAISAFISGGAGSGANIIADVAKDGKAEIEFKGLMITFLITGVMGLLLYLKQSPIPKDEP